MDGCRTLGAADAQAKSALTTTMIDDDNAIPHATPFSVASDFHSFVG